MKVKATHTHTHTHSNKRVKALILLCLVINFISTGSFAQNGNSNGNAQVPWHLNGNNADTTKFLGTTNSVDLVFKSNNIEGFRLNPSAEARFVGDVYLDKFKEVPPFNPGQNQEKRLLSINSVGQIALSSLTLAVDDMFVCTPANVAPWIHANGTSSDDDILLCPNYKSVTIEGRLFVIDKTNLGNTGIGIGNATPQARLDLAGSFRYIDGFQGMGRILVSDANGRARWTDPASVGTGSVWNTSLNGNDISYTNGNVSIGTTKVTDGPTDFMLSVAGDMRAESMEVSLANTWPDYVFDKDYSLNTLSELEKFIAKNKHLPNVPSASEVETNGINLGEMDAILLQKIEELTLYVIEQEKKIEALEKQLK